jgi:thiol-disulfide isomerase/thioredoxin
MKKIILFSLTLAFMACKTAQPIPPVQPAANVSNPEIVSKTQEVTAKPIEVMLTGQKNKADLQQAPYNAWFTPGFENYVPNPETIAALKNITDDITIKIFMGTWCEDSQNQVPHFYQVLKQIHFDENKVILITVDRSKTTPDHLEAGLNITNVPTFIIYKNGKEIQRIVESPAETLEKDLLKIVSGQTYKHTYEN